MKHIKKKVFIFSLMLLVMGCSQEDDDLLQPIVDSASLKQSYYMHESDSNQPQWLQNEIAASPYLIVYQSENKHGLYLLEYPEKGYFKQYDEGILQEVKSEDLERVIAASSPWICSHIYSFPLYPGDEEWNLYIDDINKIKEKLRLPKHLLKIMRTADLLEVCLDYQYMIDFLFYDDLQTGFEYLCKEFNGYDELLQRQDLAQTMLLKQNIQWRKMEKVKSLSDLEKGNYAIQCDLFKILLAQDRTLNAFDVTELRQMIDLCFTNVRREHAEPELFSSFDYSITLFLYARIIQRQGGFEFRSDEEKQLFEKFASTCTGNPAVLAVFTEDLQQRMISFLSRI